MKTKIILIIIITFPIHLFGLSGIIDSTNNHWGKGGNVASPVTLNGELIIKEGESLVIEPGTLILIDGFISFSGKGAFLNAIGSLDEFIQIKPANVSDMGYITISDSLFVNFKFCKFNDIKLDIRDSEGDTQMRHSLLISSQIEITRAYAKIVNNTFYTRSGRYGIYVSSSWEYQEIINNIIDDQLGGVFCFYHYTYARYNVVTADNIAPGTSPILPFCDSFDGIPHPDSSYFQGNLLGKPQFVDPENGDFHLLPKSPAVDAGEPSFDYSNENEGGGGRINMGLYGNTSEATNKFVTSASSFTLNPDISLEVFPNPATGYVTINYHLPKKAKHAQLSIFDMNGHLLKVFPIELGALANLQLNNLSEVLSPGMYVLTLECREMSINKKFLVVK